MTPKQFDEKAKKTKEGNALVTIMHSPFNVGDSFVSLVDRGANGRSFRAVKAEDIRDEVPDEGKVGKLEQFPPADPFLVPERPAGSWFERFFGTVIAMVTPKGPAMKADGKPVITFEAAQLPAELWERLWKGYDSLGTVANAVLCNTEMTVADKRKAMDAALQSYRAFVLEAFDALPTAKADDGQVIAEAAEAVSRTELAKVAKEGRVISRANAGRIRAAIKTIRAGGSAADDLETLLEDAGVIDDDTEPAAKSAIEEDPVKLNEAAIAAAETAVKVAKSANPAITPAELVVIATDASNAVFKAAVGGPAQPGIPTGELARQVAESGSRSGSASDPLTLIGSKIDSLGAAVAKLDKAISGAGEGDAREPGLVEIVEKHGEVIAAIGGKVAKMAGTPAKPQGGGAEEAGKGDAGKVAKNDGDDEAVWKGSGLSFSE